MEPTRMSMFQLLGSLCHDRGWNYAVFWKLKNKKLLWGDAYCDFPKSGGVVKNVDGIPCFNEGVGHDYFGNGTSWSSVFDVGHPLESIVANMACLVYSLGEGVKWRCKRCFSKPPYRVVGQIVITKKHHWASAEEDCGVEENSFLLSEFPNEWKRQFAAGIKTIALIPVLPYGVVQLGSLASMREDVNLVDQINSLFSSVHTPSGPEFSLTSIGCSSEPSHFLSSFMSTSSFASSSASHSLQQESRAPVVEEDQGLAVAEVQLEKNKLLDIKTQISSLSSVQDDLQMCKNDIDAHKVGPNRGTCRHGKVGEAVSGAMPTTSFEPSCVQNGHMDESYLEKNENYLEKNHIKISGSDSHLGSQGILDAACSFLFEESTSGQLFDGGISWCPTQTNGDDNLRFPASSELHKALGQAFYTGGDAYFCQSNLVHNDGLNSADHVIDQFDLEGGVETLFGDFEQWCVDRKNSEYLLDVIVSDTCFSPQGRNSLPQVTSAKPSSNSFASIDLKCELQDDFMDPALDYMCNDGRVENVHSRSSILRSSSCKMEEFSACTNGQGNDSPGSAFFSWSEGSIMTAPIDSTSMKLSTLIDEAKITNSACNLSKNEVKLPKINKKRAKPGESCRPRPRDRQLIQDRIKELREIVPNGAKCSIDALFERTIKHMLFLRNIANHVDKLKSCTQSKVVKAGSNSRHENGASWAVELGREPGSSCPLVVENLSQPGHMLVEMLCEEHGVFLEIAQVIRSLGLTILKGVMETRAEKIWAHFVIEVTKGFQRMDILWPLMQLLQPRSNATVSKF